MIILHSKTHKKIKKDIEKKIGLFNMEKNGRQEIRLKNGSRIEFNKPVNTDRIRGKHLNEIFVKRKDLDEDLKNVIYPAIASANGDLVVLSNF